MSTQNVPSLEVAVEYPSDEEETHEQEVAPSSACSDEPVCGLHNLGNTCYLNSGVQAIANSALFRAILRASPGEDVSKRLRGNSDTRKSLLLGSWRNLVENMALSNGEAVQPRGFLCCVMAVKQEFVGFSQEDSHEFIWATLGALDDELRDAFHLPCVLASFTNTTPTSPHADRQMRLYHCLDKMYKDNLKRDQSHAQREALRKGKLSGGGGAYYPRLYRSPVSQVFEGKYTSCVTCSECRGESLRVEPFMGLEIEIPPASQRSKLRAEVELRRASRARLAPHHDTLCGRLSPVASEQDLPATAPSPRNAVHNAQANQVTRIDVGAVVNFAWQMVGGITAGLVSFVVGAFYMFSFPTDAGDATTVYECLAAHFSSETLDGKYDCSHCDKKTDGVKQLSLFELPEELCLTFKRFHKNGYWISKLGTQVSFPMCNFPGQKETLSYPAELDSPLDTDASEGHSPDLIPNVDPVYLDVRDFCYVSEDLPPPDVTTYALHGMVVHQGSYHGGHYVSYVYSSSFNTWVLCNDDQVSSSPPEKVRTAGAYILVYKKRRKAAATDKPDETSLFYKARAQRYLGMLKETECASLWAGMRKEMGEDPVFISKDWLTLFVHGEEPGVICNRPSYPFDSKKPVPTRYAPEFYCPIPEADWNYFLGVYGGGPVVRKDEFIKITGAQQEMDASLKRMPE